MPPSIAPASPPSDSSSEALLRTLLDISPLGILLLRPRYAAAPAADAAPIVDFTWEQLNPAAQRMLGLPECPTESFLTLYPTAQLDGPFAFYCAAFASGQVERRQQLPAEEQQAVVVVMLTSSVSPRDQQRVRELPIADYLTKPLTQQQIERVIAQHFAG